MQRLLYFSMGLVIGAVTGYLVTKGYFKKECEVEVASVKETFQKKYAAKELAEKNSEMKKAIRDGVLNSDGSNDELYLKAKEAYAKYSSSDSSGEYPSRRPVSHNIFKDYPSESDIDIDADVFDDAYSGTVDGYSPKEDLADKPYIISSIEFENEMPFFDKQALYIYSDGVAVLEDGNDSVIEDISEILGRDAVKLIEAGGLNELYVRNEQRSSDYEVIILKEAYIPDNDPDYDE